MALRVAGSRFLWERLGGNPSDVIEKGLESREHASREKFLQTKLSSRGAAQCPQGWIIVQLENRSCKCSRIFRIDGQAALRLRHQASCSAAFER